LGGFFFTSDSSHFFPPQLEAYSEPWERRYFMDNQVDVINIIDILYFIEIRKSDLNFPTQRNKSQTSDIDKVQGSN
jgi:hypothetical protein